MGEAMVSSRKRDQGKILACKQKMVYASLRLLEPTKTEIHKEDIKTR